MRSIKILTFIFLSTSSLYAQHSLGVGFQGDYLINKPKNIEVTSAGGASFNYGYMFDFKNEWNIYPQLTIASNRYMMDGMFFESSGSKKFEETPYNYKQSRMEVLSIRMPVLINKKVIGDTKNAMFFGFGPVLAYDISINQTYKILSEKYKAVAPIDRRFHFGLQYELGIKKSSEIFKNGWYFSFGMSILNTDYLKDATSFKLISSFAKATFFIN